MQFALYKCARGDAACGRHAFGDGGARRALGGKAAGGDGALADGVDECVVLSVTDTGIGIEPSKFDQLFQPFAQLGGAQASGGTGLGLSLVRRFAELHGGRVSVASSPGRGSRFCVWLPVRPVETAHR